MSLEKDIERVLGNWLPTGWVRDDLVDELAALLQERGEPSREALERIFAAHTYFDPDSVPDALKYRIEQQKHKIKSLMDEIMAWSRTGKPPMCKVHNAQLLYCYPCLEVARPKPQRKVSREQLQKILDGYAEDCFRGNLGVEKALDALMALLSGEPEPRKWCPHMKWGKGDYEFDIHVDKFYRTENWTCCPICGAPRPATEEAT